MIKPHPKLAFKPLIAQKEYQSEALTELLAYLKSRSAFYKTIFKEHNINIKNIKSVDDIKFLPTTKKI